MRTLIIGDIHGCIDELEQLIYLFKPKTGDRIIAAGDIIGRGSDPAKCLDLLQNIKAECILGNHEYWLLHELETGEYGTNASQCDYFDASAYIDYIKSFGHFIQTDSYIVVHAGVNPNVPIKQNSDDDLVSIRYIKQTNNRVPWFNLYTGEKHIYFGHWAALGFYHDQRVTCLDGGCVYGNFLIGFCPEEDKFYRVKAAKAYQPIIYNHHKS